LIIKDNNMIPEQVRNYISGDFSEEDRIFAEKWIAEDAERAELVKELQRVWETSEDLRQLSDKEINCAWRSVKTKMGQGITVDVKMSHKASSMKRVGRRRSSTQGWILKLAAVFLIGFGLYTLLPGDGAQEESAEQVDTDSDRRVISAEYGEQVRFRLGDQSVVTLNGGSEVSFSNAYGKENRELHLSGEAYFEVNNHGQEHPFIVLTEKAVITDIGTSFNVNAYLEKETTDIIVADGEIEVRLNREQEGPTANLREGELVRVDGDDDNFTVEKVDPARYLGWLTGRLIFENETFEQIVFRLERFYNVTIDIRDEQLKSERVTASFENEQIERLMGVLALSLDAVYEIDGNRIVVDSK
jgi:transmembrane sensor